MASLLKDKILVAALDFGTTYSGYALSFTHEYAKDPMKISYNCTWVGGHQNLLSMKTPTCVLIGPDKKFDSFGYEAEDTFAGLFMDDKHHDWYFYRQFKMTLYENMKLRRDLELEDYSGKKMSAKAVFAMCIRYLKQHLLEHIEKRGTSCLIDNDSEILWVLTVPAIWNDSAKQFMREAAYEAGINDDQLAIALEPEAASLYCIRLPLDQLVNSKTGSFVGFRPGTRYMVLDLGGGTVDVTVHEVLGECKLRELHKASGGPWGGTKVDDAFLKLLTQIIGTEVLKDFKRDHIDDYFDLLKEFETKKRTIKSDTTAKITLRIPNELGESFSKSTKGENIRTAVNSSPFKGKMTWVGDKLRIDADLIKGLFGSVIDGIVNHVHQLLRHTDCQGVNIILMVGGFSECGLVQDAMRSSFANLKVVIPDDAGLVVVKGAVLYGHRPTTVVSRVAKYTYGVRSTRKFRRGEDPEEKRVAAKGVEKCIDAFDVHVRANQAVPVCESLEPQFYRPFRKTSKEVKVPLYISSSDDPKFTTDPSSSYLGTMRIQLPPCGEDEDREIEVKMTFGGTEVTVEACESKSQKSYKASFDFLDH